MNPTPVDDPVGAMLARVFQVVQSEAPADLRWFLSAEAAGAAEELRRGFVAPDGSGPLAVLYALGLFDWCRFHAGDEASGDAFGGALLHLAPVYAHDPASVPSDLTPVLAFLAGEPAGADMDPGTAHDVADGMVSVYYRLRYPGALRLAEQLMRHAARGFPDASAEQGTCLSTLGLILLHRFEESADPGHLAEAVDLSLAAVAAAPWHQTEQARRQGNLGLVLTHRAQRTGDPATARQSVDALRRAVELGGPDDPHRSLHLANLGAALNQAGRLSGETGQLAEAVPLLRRAVAAEDPRSPKHARYQSELGTALTHLAVETDQRDLFDQGIAAFREAVRTAVNDHDRALHLANLAYALCGHARRTGDARSVEAALDAVRQALDHAPPEQSLRGQAQWVLAEVLEARFAATGSAADLDGATTAAREAVRLTPPGRPQRVIRLCSLADLLRKGARTTSAPERLADAVQILREALGETRPESTDRARILLELGTALDGPGDTEQFWSGEDGRADGDGSGKDEQDDEALRCFRACLTLPAPYHRFPSRVRRTLGTALARRGASRGDRRLWEEGAGLVREGLDLLAPDDPFRTEYLDALGCLHQWAGRTGDPAHYAEAVRYFREAVAEARPDSRDRAHSLSNLGAALCNLGHLTADLDLLAESVRVHRQAVAASAPTDIDLPFRLGNLGDALQQLAESTSDVGLLREGIGVLRDSVAAAPEPHPGRADCLSRLGNALRALARFTGETAPIEEAVRWHREALAAQGGAAPPRRLTGLANALQDLCRRTGDEAPGAEAVRLFQAALASAANAAPDERAIVLHDLGRSQFDHAVNTGDDVLMETAIGMLRDSVATMPPRHVKRGNLLTTLGAALMRRSSLTGDTTWQEEAVDVLRTAVAQCAPTAFERAGLLSNLAEALRGRYESTGDRAAADEAVALLREAMSLGDGERFGRQVALANLGTLLQSVSFSDQDTASQAEACELFERALVDYGEDHGWRGFLLTNLAGASWQLTERIRDTGSPLFRSALHRAVTAAREAVSRTPDGHPDRARAQWILAEAQLRRASLGERVDLAETARLARQAAENPTPTVPLRVQAARTWGDAAAAAGQDAEALAGYAYAVELLPRVAPRSLRRADQEERLGIGRGLACDAAAFALRAGDPYRALTLLEQGRGVLISRGQDDRGDLSRLRERDPALAAEFDRLRDELSTDPARPPAVRTDPGAGDPAEDWYADGRRAEARHAMARQWDRLVERIRALPGMEGFLRPPRTRDLLAAAADGPVVVVNVSRHRSDAILVTGESVRAVPLPGLSFADALAQAAAFTEAVDEAYGMRDPDRALRAVRRLTETLEWLWDTVAEPVLDRLGLRYTPDEGEPWPRLWWCPTGWLSFLPLHAAGRHLTGTGASVLDRAVSSYTPTLRALALGRAGARAEPAGRPAPLVVALPETPGAGPLPGAAREADLITRLFPGASRLSGPQATVDAVRRALPGHSWAHFSCHGVSDRERPSQSGLQLYDGRLRALDAAAEHLKDPVLAVLSACSTSQGGFGLPDEVIHLASSFQLAGYRHVIGTLWPVSDRLSTWLTEDLYTSLAAQGHEGRAVDPAAALHRSVRALRDRFARAPHLWAAHTHHGA